MRILASALGAVALASCAAGPVTGDPPDSGPREAPRIELGTGRETFVAIPEAGATLELVMGPQGGYHVDVTIRLWAVDPEDLELVYEVSRPGATSPLSRTPFVLDASRFRREGDHLVRTGDFTVLDIAGPSDVEGDEVIVRVTARARDATTVSDERTVTIVDAM